MRIFDCEGLEGRMLFSGVTILIHGFNSDPNEWEVAMANAIQQRMGGAKAASQYELQIGEGSSGNLQIDHFLRDARSPDPKTTTTGEIIVRVDWSGVSTGDFSTGEVADQISRAILSSRSGLPAVADLPIHIIGHSRGASVATALCKNLGRAGVWVEQVTNLDPHPVEGVNDPIGLDFDDQKMATFDNVEFSDTYWRTDDNSNNLDFDGEAVAGSHNLNLEDSVQAHHGDSAHSEVPFYYDGTINLKATSLAGHPIRSAWYDTSASRPARNATGYLFSRIVAGTRPADGVSKLFGGAAARSTLVASGKQWADIADVGTSANTFAAATTITLSYRYEDRDSAASIRFFLDTDQNPLNGRPNTLKSVSVARAKNPVRQQAAAKIPRLAAGKYFLGAVIADRNGHTRYAYAVGIKTIT